jgi:hypothetical protein
VAVVPVESAIAGKRFTLIEQAKGCHGSMAPFFVCFSRIRLLILLITGPQKSPLEVR